MSLWIIIAVVGWASFQVGRRIAVLFSAPVKGARASSSLLGSVAVLVILIAAVFFFVRNQRAKTYPFTALHTAILAGCVVFGYQSARGRRISLQEGINSLSQGVSQVFAQPLSCEERLKALLALAMRNEVIASKLKIGIFIEGPDGGPRGSIKAVGAALIDDPAFANGTRTSPEQKTDLLLQEIGFAILAKFGEDVMPKHQKRYLSPRDLRNLQESGERTRALLDASAIDWPAVNDALYHISEARLRRGIELSDLTPMEQHVRSARRVTTSTPIKNSDGSA